MNEDKYSVPYTSLAYRSLLLGNAQALCLEVSWDTALNLGLGRAPCSSKITSFSSVGSRERKKIPKL